jgi:hypothetical protein
MRTDEFFLNENLRKFLTSLRQQTQIFPLKDWVGQYGVILRHDVDVDIDLALRMAELEMDLQIKSSFFFLTTSDHYNVTSLRSRNSLKRIANMGFEIGLHFDTSIYGETGLDRLSELAVNEAEILSESAESPVLSLSLHNPSILGQYTEIPGFKNAYAPLIFSPEVYISDSRRSFNPLVMELAQLSKLRTMQLLLHPLHFSNVSQNYNSVFVDLIKRKAANLHEDFLVNSTYKETYPYITELLENIQI